MKVKFIFKTIVLTAVTAFILSSCNKNSDNSPSVSTVSEEEAAQAITQSVMPETGGMAAQSSQASAIATVYAVKPCGESFDSSISMQSVAGAAFTYSVNLKWGWNITCTSPVEFQSYFSGHTTYNAPRMSSDDSSHATMVLTGLGDNSTAYTSNLSYVRNGSQQSKIGNKNAFSSLITITSTNIMVDKTTDEISSGTATATISGATTGGKSFSYNGTLTFHGSKTATLVMGSGARYEISW